jgi:hypothetical protein
MGKALRMDEQIQKVVAPEASQTIVEFQWPSKSSQANNNSQTEVASFQIMDQGRILKHLRFLVQQQLVKSLETILTAPFKQ